MAIQFFLISERADGFRLCLEAFELLLDFFHRNTRFNRGRTGNGAEQLRFRDLRGGCFLRRDHYLVSYAVILVLLSDASKAAAIFSGLSVCGQML